MLVIRQDSRNEPLTNSGAGTFNLGMVKRGTGKVVSLQVYNNDVLNALTATDGLPGLDAENAVYIIRNRGRRLGGTLDQQWPTDLDPTLLPRQGARDTGPVIRGQSQFDEPRYWHSNPLAGSERNGATVRGDISTGPLHEPMRLAPVDQSVVNAYYEAAPSRAVDQANWTGHSLGSGDSNNPVRPSGVISAAAWNDASPSNRYGNTFPAHELQGVAQQQSWFDPAAQGRAIQLASSDAWSVQIASQNQQAVPGPSPIQYAPQLYRPAQFPIAAGAQTVPFTPTLSQQAMPGQSPYGAMPFVAAPVMSPNPARPSGVIAPQYHDPSMIPGQPAAQWPPVEGGHSEASNLGLDGRHVIRIPIRLGPGETADIREEDIILQDGDIVFIESRDTEVFFTGGLLGGGQFTLPRDYDLDILQALSLATAQGNSGSARAVGGVSALNNDVSISPSTVIVLRKLPDGGEVPIKVDLYRARTDLSERIVIQPGDYILLQYTPLEAIAAFVERHLLEGALFGIASQSLNQGN